MPIRAVLFYHFLRDLVRSEFLSEAGVDAYRAWLISVGAALIGFHIALPRLLLEKYKALASPRFQHLHQASLQCDELFLCSLAFLLIAFITLLQWQSLFPGEREFYVLAPLPLRRVDIFAAKAGALLLFVFVFIVVIDVPPAMLFPPTSVGHSAPDGILLRMGAQLLAGTASSLCAFAGVIALQGVLLVTVPHHLRSRVSGFLQALLLIACIALLPMAWHLPAQFHLVQHPPGWLEFLPPAWFLAWIEVLRGNGDPYWWRLASIGIVGLGGSVAAAFGSYALLYKRFADFAAPPLPVRSSPSLVAHIAHPVLRFAALTIARSAPHRLLLAALGTFGAALALDSFLSVAIFGRSAALLDTAAFTMPLLLVFSLCTALRFTFRLPVQPRANWPFQLTESPERREWLLDSATRGLLAFGVAPALLLPIPLQVAAFGFARTAAALPLFLLMSLCLVEASLRRWRSLPFTCTYSPGNRPVALTALVFFFAFSLFAYLGGEIVYVSTRHPANWLIFAGILLSTWSVLRIARLREWGAEPLLFEDHGEPVVIPTGFAGE